MRIAILGGLLICALVACSDDDGPVKDASGNDIAQSDGGIADQGPSPDLAVTPGPLVVTVKKIDGLWQNDLTETPAVDVLVFADLPGGERVEQRTDAQGKVTFTDVAWAKGRAAVTAYAAGYRLHSIVGLQKADGDQLLRLFPRFVTPDQVTLSGSVSNLDAEADYLVVSSNAAPQIYQGAQVGAYNLKVAKDQALTLLAAQANDAKSPDPRIFPLLVLGWTKTDVAAQSADAIADIDFSSAEASTTATVTFELPTTAGSLVGTASRPEAYVNGLMPDGFVLGLPQKSTKLDDTTFEIEVDYVSLLPPEKVVTRYYVMVGANNYGSTVGKPGYPQDGETVSGFLEVPQVTYPTSTSTSLPYYDRFEFINPEPEAITGATLTDQLSGDALWVVSGPKGAESLAIPPLPSSVTAADVFGSGTIHLQIGLAADFDETRLMFGRVANGQRYAVNASDPTATCTDQSYNGHAYKFCSALSWAAANVFCKAQKMKLVRVDDQAENDWIESTGMTEFSDWGQKGVWLGGSDQAQEGRWVWPDGEGFHPVGSGGAFAFFHPDQPDDAGGREDCLEMFTEEEVQGFWNDAYCALHNPFVCEAY